MIITSKTLRKIRDMFFNLKTSTSTRPMWAYEAELTRRNTAVFGLVKRNEKGMRALDLFFSITAALVIALALMLPPHSSYIPLFSFLAIALISAVTGGKIIILASFIAPFLYAIFEAGQALGEPVFATCLIIWLGMTVIYRGLSELWYLILSLIVRGGYDYAYNDYRRGNGDFALFPVVFILMQLGSLLLFYVSSWTTFSVRGVSYPYSLIWEEALRVLIFVVPQALCAMLVKNEYDTAIMLYHRLWDNYKADVVDGKAVFRTLVIGLVLTIFLPCAGYYFLFPSFPSLEVLKESLISAGIVLASFILFPLWRFLLSTAPGGGVMATTIFIDSDNWHYRDSDYKDVLDFKRR